MVSAITLLVLSLAECSYAFQIPYSSSVSITQQQNNRITLFAKDEKGTLFFAEGTDTTSNMQQQSTEVPNEESNNQLFDSGTLAEANDALSNVGWSGVAPIQGDGEMTSDDPFVKQIDESIRGEIGVGLDELLNPAKVSCLYLLHRYLSNTYTIYLFVPNQHTH